MLSLFFRVHNPKRRTTPLSLLIDRIARIARIREGYNPGDERLIGSDVRRLVGPCPDRNFVDSDLTLDLGPGPRLLS
jgi:hypothetical protein